MIDLFYSQEFDSACNKAAELIVFREFANFPAIHAFMLSCLTCFCALFPYGP